jgi:hypothetical protein
MEIPGMNGTAANTALPAANCRRLILRERKDVIIDLLVHCRFYKRSDTIHDKLVSVRRNALETRNSFVRDPGWRTIRMDTGCRS